jgi:hypothetical protein
MIVFDLICTTGHVFEAWFGSSQAYDDQCARGLVACPICSDTRISKAVMAPAVAAKGNRQSGEVPSDPAQVKMALAALAEMQTRMEANADYVGDRFPAEARALHLGETPLRPIYGEATPSEAAALIDEGITLQRLPFRPRSRSDA